MLNFTDCKLSETELQAAFSLGKNSLADEITPLGNVQERVMENLLGHIINHFMAAGEFAESLPVDYSIKPNDILTNICSQLADRAMVDGLLLDVGDEKDDYCGYPYYGI